MKHTSYEASHNLLHTRYSNVITLLMILVLYRVVGLSLKAQWFSIKHTFSENIHIHTVM